MLSVSRIVIGLCCLLYLGARAQTIMTVDLYRLGTVKRIRFYPGDPITYKLKGGRMRHSTFAGGRDSLVYLGDGNTVAFSEIRTIMIDRSNWLVRKLYRTGMIGGVFIVAIDAANNIGNRRPTVVDTPFLEVGASMVAAGIILRFASRRYIHPGPNRRLQILNLDPA